MNNTTKNSETTNRFGTFAKFFKGYMSASAVVVAALPIAFEQLGVIPGFKVHKDFLPTYTSLFCFLILAFCFYSRYRLAWWMFHNELNGRSVGFARPIKTAFRFIPFVLIGICFACIIWYHNILDQSIITIREELVPKTETPEQTQTNKQTETPEQEISIDKKASVKYFGQILDNLKSSSIEDFQASKGQLNSNFILKNADPSFITDTSETQGTSELKWLFAFLKLLTSLFFILIIGGIILKRILRTNLDFIYALIITIALIMLGFFLIQKLWTINICDTWVWKPINVLIQGIIGITKTKNSQLIISYLGIFITAQTAFVLMALREYLQDVLEASGLFKKANAQQQLNGQVCEAILNQDSSEICYFFVEQNAKLDRNVAQNSILDREEIKKIKSKKRQDLKLKIFDNTNYKQNIINDILKNPNKSIDPNNIKALIDDLEELKKAFKKLHKWEKVREVNDIIDELNKRRTFKYLSLFSSNGYDENDYYLTLKNAAEKIETDKGNRFTAENLLKEIEKVIEQEESKAEKNLKNVILYLLLWNFQPKKRCKEWLDLIKQCRENLENDFKTSRSLKSYYKDNFDKVYSEAPELASEQTKLPLDQYLKSAPFDFDDVLNKDYLDISSTKNLKNLIAELLKYTYRKHQEKHEYEAWGNLIQEHRENLENDFQGNFSLKSYYKENFATVYSEASQLASTERESFLYPFPESPPFDFDEAFKEDHLKISIKENLKKVIEGIFEYKYKENQSQETKKTLKDSIKDHRQNLNDDINKNDSLKKYPTEKYGEVYKEVYDEVSKQMKIPKEPGLSLENILDTNYLPIDNP